MILRIKLIKQIYLVSNYKYSFQIFNVNYGIINKEFENDQILNFNYFKKKLKSTQIQI